MRKRVDTKVFPSKNSKTKLFLITSIILILSLSLVSAGIIEDILGKLFGLNFDPTGDVVDDNCFDSDGKNNFNLAGHVTQDGTTTYDSCSGNVAKDYYCCDSTLDPTCGGDIPAATVFLPITGNAVSGGEPAYTTKDCSLNGSVCVGGGICGCINGETKACSTGMSGSCSTGISTCTNSQWGSCIPPSSLEICGNGLDEDCDGTPDDQCMTPPPNI